MACRTGDVPERRGARRRWRWRRLAPAVGTAVLVALAGSLVPSPGRAEWPPPIDAIDLSDPVMWPNDPGYHYCPSASPYCEEGDRRDGLWELYSFVPTQSGDRTLRSGETASGVRADLAWRFTTGRRDPTGDDPNQPIAIAIMDSGIEWDEIDLLDRHLLNPVELASFRPTNQGETCGDAVGLGGETLVGFDCNGDGILSVSDYADAPFLLPEAEEGRPRGDANRNGVLDPGDLILNFSDGIDDDQNGYVDDICGWDFAKDDNDPYDDTRYSHGTGQAKNALAEGDNGIGGIGVCPHCRHIPMRVGDSFVADVNAFAQATVYAVDRGAKVIQSALGTVNNNRFTQAALDYAWDRGVFTVASMADENARHHNMPTVSNHTLPVHAIRYLPDDRVTSVETFFGFNWCTNFGGQNMLSVSGKRCSSQAVGIQSGAAGLLYAAADRFARELRPAEAQQLFISTAEDIDIPESREPVEEGERRKYQWSQPGFDQRFGYGRTDVGRAVARVVDNRIPPGIDITSPRWFEILYRDQLTGAVDLEGTISAPRATSYDYVVEWAPGVQPLDGEFTEIASETNVPNDVVTGSEGPIARLDARTYDTTHEWDIDSPLGENQHTITVRIRAVAHYGGDIGDVSGVMHRTIYVHGDPTLAKGFPLRTGESMESSPKLADIDGDGIRDIVYATSGGRILVLRLTEEGPEPIEGFPFEARLVDGLADEPGIEGKPNYRADAASERNGYAADAIDYRLARSAFLATPAIADIDDDGRPEIVAVTWNGFLYVVGHDGAVEDGFPVRLPEVPSCPLDGSPIEVPCSDPQNIIDRGAFASPVLVDMDADGDLDIVQAAFDGKIYVFDREGQPLEGWPVDIGYDGDLLEAPGRARVLTTPAAADFDGDGLPELLVGSNQKLGEGSTGAVYLVDGRGAAAPRPYRDHWPVTMTSIDLLPTVGEGLSNPGVIGVFDGEIAAVAHGNGSPPLVLPLDPGAQVKPNETPPRALPDAIDEVTGLARRGLAPSSRFGAFSEARQPDAFLPLFSGPSVADIDQDGVLDVIAAGGSLSLTQSLAGAVIEPGQHFVGVWSGASGEMLPGSPFVLEDYSFQNSQAIADLDGDDYPEVLAGSGGYFLHAWDGCGSEPEGWPKFTGQWITATPAVGDLDGDDKLEVVVGTRSGSLFVWHTEGRTDGQIPWESYHHDNRNTGFSEVPLEQGDPTRQAAEPLTGATCEALFAVPPREVPLEVSGGCSCRVADADRRGPSGAPWLWLLGLVGLARRRGGGRIEANRG